MKRFILAIAAIATLTCGCDKLDDRISKLEERVTTLEQACADLNTTITAVQKIADAQAAGISIKEVTKVENGFQISFSDGTSYSIINGAKGDKPGVAAVEENGVFYWQVNGEWLLDGERNKLPLTGTTLSSRLRRRSGMSQPMEEKTGRNSVLLEQQVSRSM